MALKTLIDTSSAAQFKFEKIGTVLKGYLVASEEFALNGKMVRKHVLQTPKGLIGTLGSTGLNRGIDTLINQFGLGLWVEIKFTGTMKTKQPLPMKMFEFGYDENNRVDVGGSEAVIGQEEVVEESDADYAPSEEELVEEVEAEPAPKAAAPTRLAANPAAVSKEASSRVQNLLSRRSAR